MKSLNALLIRLVLQPTTKENSTIINSLQAIFCASFLIKKEQELSNHLEYWLYYLNHLASSQAIPKTFIQDKLLTEAFHVAEFLALSKDEQFSYQLDLKQRLDYKNVMDYAKEEAEKKGMEIGMEKRIEKAKTEMAKRLLDVLDIETIALKSDLSIEAVQQLKNEGGD